MLEVLPMSPNTCYPCPRSVHLVCPHHLGQLADNIVAGLQIGETTKRSAEAAKENQRVIDGLATSLYAAGLAGEALAVAKAKASLNQFATPEEIANVEALAKAVYEAGKYQPNRQLLGQVDPIAGEQMTAMTCW